MLRDNERLRFNKLRDLRDNGQVLSPEESAEVAEFTRRIEEGEAVYLRPATEQLHRENAKLDARLHAIHQLIAHEEQFLERLNATIDELRREREFINTERQRLFAGAV
jgi:EAL domain-containing protein (putative c-di-GMP-specific phosphodiesterase class I)